MSKELDALQDLSRLVFIYGGMEQYKIIENALKSLEIIKGIVDFNVYEMQGNYYLTTGNNYRGQIYINKEVYELLKEVFL